MKRTFLWAMRVHGRHRFRLRLVARERYATFVLMYEVRQLLTAYAGQPELDESSWCRGCRLRQEVKPPPTIERRGGSNRASVPSCMRTAGKSEAAQ